MKQISECKKRVREMLRDCGYKKIQMSEDRMGVQKVYYIFDGVINIRVNDQLSFHFGEDRLMGCSAHICAGGTDCGTHYAIAEETFKKLLLGMTSCEEIVKHIESL